MTILVSFFMTNFEMLSGPAEVLGLLSAFISLTAAVFVNILGSITSTVLFKIKIVVLSVVKVLLVVSTSASFGTVSWRLVSKITLKFFGYHCCLFLVRSDILLSVLSSMRYT